MKFEETPAKKYNTETKKTKETKKMKKEQPTIKQPKSVKLSTIWKALVYTFAVVGVVLSIMYVNDIVDNVVDSRAEAKASEILKAQPATTVAPAAPSKTNQ